MERKFDNFKVWMPRKIVAWSDKSSPLKLIDEVTFLEGSMTCAEVRDSLVNHDGYSANIIVTKEELDEHPLTPYFISNEH